MDFVVAGIGPNADSATALARLGKPDSVAADDYPNEPGIKMYAFYYRDLSVGIRYGVLGGIILETGAIPTARGVRVGDPASRVLQLYGPPSGRSTESWNYLDPNDHLHAIAFRITEDTVRSIFIGSWID
ncbi:MAG TPA: hypothetical protein VK573_04265 [Gemmatimonadales bacterium]|nr:hypothetical protein [Gemmatimonadales bacterium]